MADQRRRCGPWRETWLGRVRRCNNPLLPEEGALEIERRQRAHAVAARITAEQQPDPAPEPPPEPTPPAERTLPERKTPPDCERLVITERTNTVARKLVDSVFGPGKGEQA